VWLYVVTDSTLIMHDRSTYCDNSVNCLFLVTDASGMSLSELLM